MTLNAFCLIFLLLAAYTMGKRSDVAALVLGVLAFVSYFAGNSVAQALAEWAGG